MTQPSELADRRAARRAADRQLPAHRHRHSAPTSRRAACRRGWRARTPTGGSTQLYAFVRELGATTVHTAISRTVIDVNRDPSGVSLYPGQNTTELVPHHDLRRRAAVEARHGARRGRDRAAQGHLLRPLPRRARRRDRAPARAASARRALRLPLDPLDHPAPVPRRAAGDQHRHQRRRVLRPGPRRADRRHRLAPAASPPSSTAASRAATSRGTTARRTRACTRCRWSWPAAATCASPSARWTKATGRCRSTRPSPPTSAPRCAPSSKPACASPRTAKRDPHDPHRQRPHHPRPARHRHLRQELADRSAAAHADEQPRPRGGREAGRTGGLRRHRPRRARLGELRPHRRRAAQARGRRDAAGAVRQAGRRLPHPCRRAARADRQLQPRAALGHLGALQRARSQGPDDVRPDDGRLLDLHRQPGHRAGHLRDLRRGGPAALRRQPRRQMDPDRGPRRHGRRAAAGRGDGRRLHAGRRMPAEPHRDAPAAPAISTRRPRRSTRRWR